MIFRASLPLLMLTLFIGCFGHLCAETSHAQERGKEAEEAGVPVFTFNSGMALEFGMWTISVNTNGRATIEHDMHGKKSKWDALQLSQKHNATLWERIEAADIPNQKSATRAGVPDEVTFTYALKENDSVHRFRKWEKDAMKVDELRSLTAWLGLIVAKHTGRDVRGQFPNERPERDRHRVQDG